MNNSETCTACRGKGWLVANDSDGMRIERCDSCQRFASDEDAVGFVIESLNESSVALKEAFEHLGYLAPEVFDDEEHEKRWHQSMDRIRKVIDKAEGR